MNWTKISPFRPFSDETNRRWPFNRSLMFPKLFSIMFLDWQMCRAWTAVIFPSVRSAQYPQNCLACLIASSFGVTCRRVFRWSSPQKTWCNSWHEPRLARFLFVIKLAKTFVEYSGIFGMPVIIEAQMEVYVALFLKGALFVAPHLFV